MILQGNHRDNTNELISAFAAHLGKKDRALLQVQSEYTAVQTALSEADQALEELGVKPAQGVGRLEAAKALKLSASISREEKS